MKQRKTPCSLLWCLLTESILGTEALKVLGGQLGDRGTVQERAGGSLDWSSGCVFRETWLGLMHVLE